MGDRRVGFGNFGSDRQSSHRMPGAYECAINPARKGFRSESFITFRQLGLLVRGYVAVGAT